MSVMIWGMNMSTGERHINVETTAVEGSSALKLENESFEAFLRALDESVPAEMKDLMRREPQWA